MDIKSMFPRASQAFLDANSTTLSSRGGAVSQKPKQNESTGILKRSRGIMNKTESEFSLILEAQKRRGEILRWEFEAVTLRWFDMRYTPDFFVLCPISSAADSRPLMKFIEIKGKYIHYSQQAIARFKGARGFWPEFQFEMHQKTKEGWKQIL